MVQELAERLAEAIADGKAESVGESVFVPLLELDSGARIGLDEDGTWLSLSPAGELRRFGEGTEGHFVEVVEGNRHEFDERLGAAADALGLPGRAVVVAFPTVPLLRAVLARRSSYLVRLGLLWLLPSELRELRPEIGEIARDKLLPLPIRGLAERLTVPT